MVRDRWVVTFRKASLRTVLQGRVRMGREMRRHTGPNGNFSGFGRWILVRLAVFNHNKKKEVTTGFRKINMCTREIRLCSEPPFIILSTIPESFESSEDLELSSRSCD